LPSVTLRFAPVGRDVRRPLAKPVFPGMPRLHLTGHVRIGSGGVGGRHISLPIGMISSIHAVLACVANCGEHGETHQRRKVPSVGSEPACNRRSTARRRNELVECHGSRLPRPSTTSLTCCVPCTWIRNAFNASVLRFE